MPRSTLSKFTDLLRNDFVGFAHRAFLELYPLREFEANWHIEVIAEKLEAVRRGKIRRLIINLPPRNLKSYLGSIAFPAYFLGHNPSSEVLCTSYGELPVKNHAIDCRNLMLSPFYQALFETRLSEDRQAVEEFKTTTGGARRGLSLRGSITGSGADLIIVDDPIKAEDALSETIRDQVNSLFFSSIDTRTNRDTGAVVIIMQRLHQNDLCGFVQKRGTWDVLTLPAIAEKDEAYRIRTPYGRRILGRTKGEALQPLRQSVASLNEKRSAQGARTFDAQYQQKPHGAEGAIIKREWLNFYDEYSKPEDFEITLQSWDTGVKSGEHNSFSACTTWGIQDRKFYLLHVAHEQMDFRQLKQRAYDLARQFNPARILIEDQSLGRALFAELEYDQPAELVPVGGASKSQRLLAHSNIFESGRVLVSREIAGVDAYIDELTTFPDSDFSDQVDSTTQALSYDVSNIGFLGAMELIRLQSDDPDARRPKKMVKLRVLISGGRLDFNDGERPPMDFPAAGTIIVVDEEMAIWLQNMYWSPPKFERIRD